jgi:hypothetical protein
MYRPILYLQPSHDPLAHVEDTLIEYARGIWP